jgi:hypothetical protein
MADANTPSDDWWFWVTKMKYSSEKSHASLAFLMYSEVFKLVHEFHIVGSSSDPSLTEVNYDFNMDSVTIDGGKKITLKSMRGLPGWVTQYNGKLNFGATTAGGYLYLTTSKKPADSPDYSMTGMWLLRRTLHYSEVFGT